MPLYDGRIAQLLPVGWQKIEQDLKPSPGFPSPPLAWPVLWASVFNPTPGSCCPFPEYRPLSYPVTYFWVASHHRQREKRNQGTPHCLWPSPLLPPSPKPLAPGLLTPQLSAWSALCMWPVLFPHSTWQHRGPSLAPFPPEANPTQASLRPSYPSLSSAPFWEIPVPLHVYKQSSQHCL